MINVGTHALLIHTYKNFDRELFKLRHQIRDMAFCIIFIPQRSKLEVLQPNYLVVLYKKL